MSSLPEFTITHFFNAPRHTVWQAWTDPKQVAQWFGPKGSSCDMLKHELKVGGIVHSRIAMQGAPVMYGKFTFTEITPESRLAWKHSFSDEGGVALTRHPFVPLWPLELLTTVTFMDEGQGTHVVLTWVPSNAKPEEIEVFREAIPGMNQGWGGSFEQLDEYLAKTKAA